MVKSTNVIINLYVLRLLQQKRQYKMAKIYYVNLKLVQRRL
jgi:hypothetical protein